MTGLEIQNMLNRGGHAGQTTLDDPGDDNEIDMVRDFTGMVCFLKTTDTGNEARFVPRPANMPPGAEITVHFEERSGGGTPYISLTQQNASGNPIDFNVNGDQAIQLDAPGSWVMLKLIKNTTQDKAWQIVASDTVTLV